MKKSNMINVPVEFVIDALQARYDDVKDRWGDDASESLWEQALQLVEECGLGENVTSPSIYVDNYLVNGEFIRKEDNQPDWLEKTSFNDYVNFHNLTEVEILDLKGSPMFNEFWGEYCQDNALIYNDEYVCIQF